MSEPSSFALVFEGILLLPGKFVFLKKTNKQTCHYQSWFPERNWKVSIVSKTIDAAFIFTMQVFLDKYKDKICGITIPDEAHICAYIMANVVYYTLLVYLVHLIKGVTLFCRQESITILK